MQLITICYIKLLRQLLRVFIWYQNYSLIPLLWKISKKYQKNQLHFIKHFYVTTHAKIIQTTSFGVSKSSPFVSQCPVVYRNLLICTYRLCLDPRFSSTFAFTFSILLGPTLQNVETGAGEEKRNSCAK